MKTGFRVFLGAFVALGFSWLGFVLAPALQLGTQGQTTVLNSSQIYPNQRPGAATLGLQVYRANGCAACHTTQVGQDGVVCEVVLTSPGSNPSAVHELVSGLTLTNLTKEEADLVANKISAAGGKTETHTVPTGPDISRGWGLRHSVAEDFLWDNPVQLGSLRVGPDLSNVGMRYDAHWLYVHLYNPRDNVKDSIMPSYEFLFTVAPATNDFPSSFDIEPTEDARNLVAYLLSLRADVALYDAPFSVASPGGTQKK